MVNTSARMPVQRGIPIRSPVMAQVHVDASAQIEASAPLINALLLLQRFDLKGAIGAIGRLALVSQRLHF